MQASQPGQGSPGKRRGGRKNVRDQGRYMCMRVRSGKGSDIDLGVAFLRMIIHKLVV